MRHHVLLNGAWDFSFSENAMPEEYRKQRFDNVLAVPSCFDVMRPWYGKRGTGFFRRHVHTGGLVKLSVDGVGFEAKIYWDGLLIGTMDYAYMPESFFYDAGPTGEHELVIAVSNRFNKVFFSSFDFYGFGGIYGDVELEELPAFYINFVRITATDYQKGIAEFLVEASAAVRKKKRIKFQFDGGKTISLDWLGKKNLFRISVPNFKVWSPEHPQLHSVRITLGDDEVMETFGFREIRACGEQLLLNEKKLRLFGYNRHTHHPDFGAAVPAALTAADLQMLKEQGCNFIRGAHYPQRKSFLELCDRMGFLVWEETLAWAMKPPELFEKRFFIQQQEQLKRMIGAHFNHPSIIFWAFLNEVDSHRSKTRAIVRSLSGICHKLDPSRLVTYATNKIDSDLCFEYVDVLSINLYPVWFSMDAEAVDEMAKIRPRYEEMYQIVKKNTKKHPKPYMISETGAAALYGFHDPFKGRWSEEFQAEVIREECKALIPDERYCGVVFWHFADAKCPIMGSKILSRVRGYNNKGHLDEYRRPKLAWDVVHNALELHRETKHQGHVRGGIASRVHCHGGDEEAAGRK